MASKSPGRDDRADDKTTSDPSQDGLPTHEQVLEAMNADPSLSSKRDLARYFGIKGADRAPFKRLLKELEGEGLITRRRKSLKPKGELPSVTVLDIDPDSDPDEMIARPSRWDEEDDGERPTVLIEADRQMRVVPAPGDRILARIHKSDGAMPRYSARPMKILEKPRRAQIGIVRMDDDGARLLPIDRKNKEMRIPKGDLGDARDGDLVEVEIKTSGRAMVPRARVTGVIGNPLSEGAVSLIALHNLEIPYRFPDGVVREAEAVEPAGLKGREDWREIPFVTIDPETAKDHDDAVFAMPDEDEKNPGGHVVFVAIADVAAYVTTGSALDREAYMRGNSVYFPDRVVPMLPERISNDLCSLREKENRPALAVRMVIGPDGNRKSHSFHRVTMRSEARLSYQQAQAAFDGKPDDATGPLQDAVLKPLHEAYKAMAKARDKRGPLHLDLPERRIILNDKGLVDRVHVPERLDAHRLIEELMVTANVCAAETLERKHSRLIYRTHDAPGPEKLVALREFLGSLDMSFSRSDAVSPVHFNRVLDKAVDSPHAHQVSEMVLRTQAQAEYSAENYGHFGLNLERYAHFTSPIRRYADLIVHRALIGALELGSDGLTREEESALAGIAQHISGTERRAMAAERETQDRLIAQFLVGQVGTRFNGRISGVIRSGLFVKLNETGADGFVPAASLGNDYFRFMEDEQAMIGDRTGERFRLGDDVEVRLLEAAPMAGALRFELLSEGERVKPSNGRGPRGRRKFSGKGKKPAKARKGAGKPGGKGRKR